MYIVQRLVLCLALMVITLSARSEATFPKTIIKEEAKPDNWTVSSGDMLSINSSVNIDDGSEMVTPYVELRNKAGQNLGNNKITYRQLTNLTSGYYTIKVKVRIYNEKNFNDFPSGIYLTANDSTWDLSKICTSEVYDIESAIVYGSIEVKCKVHSKAKTLDVGFTFDNAVGNWFSFKDFEIIFNDPNFPKLTGVTGKMGKEAEILQSDILEEYNSNPSYTAYLHAMELIEEAQKSKDYYAPIASLDSAGLSVFEYLEDYLEGTLDETKDISDAIIAATIVQRSEGAELSYLVQHNTWKGQTSTYKTGVENCLDAGSFAANDTVLMQSITGLIPGYYKLQFYAVANSKKGSLYGDSIAQAFANDQNTFLTVRQQEECEPEDSLITFYVNVGNDGTINYGIRNIRNGGDWYVIKAKSLRLIRISSTMVPNYKAVMKYSGNTSANMTEGNNADIVNLPDDIWEVTADMGGLKMYPGLRSDKSIALYYNSTKCHSVSVRNRSLIIDSIRVYCQGTYNKYTISVNDSNITSDTTDVYVINADGFTIGNGFTSAKQVRIDSIAIYYKEDISVHSLGKTYLSENKDNNTLEVSLPCFIDPIGENTDNRYMINVTVSAEGMETVTRSFIFEVNDTLAISLDSLMVGVPYETETTISIEKQGIRLVDPLGKALAENKGEMHIAVMSPKFDSIDSVYSNCNTTSTTKILVNGKLVITKRGKRYSTAGNLLK